MAKAGTKMRDLQELLQDESLRERIERASDFDAVTTLIEEAGSAKGYSLDKEWLFGFYADVLFARAPATFTEEELMDVANGMMSQDSAPKLCHTASCGGNHAGCC